MARNITQYDLLISCPGDAAESVDVIKGVVEEFNQQFGDVLGINIRWRYWKDSAYAESGGKPQELLNKQVVDNSDLAVAIFKNRFGSPTDKYESGTEEEIERMLSEGRQVFLFFDESPVKVSDVDRDEYDKIQHFKEKYKERGVFWSFNNEVEFRSIFRAHITRYFMALSNDSDTEGKSNLIIKSYIDGKIREDFRLSLFEMGGIISGEKLILQIEDMIEQINNMKLVKSNLPVQPAFDLFVGKKVELEENTINIISAVADKLEITLTDDFFDIGNITESPTFSNLPFGGREINGTKEEKTKYNAIISLKELIYKTTTHMQMEQLYKELYGVKLVLCNEGTRFDEDIDVEIVIPEDRFLDIEELPIPSEEVNLGDDLCFEDIFEIPATKDFISYSDTKKPLSGFTPNHYTPVNPFGSIDYEEEYRDTLRDIFDYQVYPDGKHVFIKIHFDYIKQHQCAAFPTWIFVKKPGEGLCAKYSITTKNNKNVIEGQIDIKPVTN